MSRYDKAFDLREQASDRYEAEETARIEKTDPGEEYLKLIDEKYTWARRKKKPNPCVCGSCDGTDCCPPFC